MQTFSIYIERRVGINSSTFIRLFDLRQFSDGCEVPCNWYIGILDFITRLWYRLKFNKCYYIPVPRQRNLSLPIGCAERDFLFHIQLKSHRSPCQGGPSTRWSVHVVNYTFLTVRLRIRVLFWIELNIVTGLENIYDLGVGLLNATVQRSFEKDVRSRCPGSNNYKHSNVHMV